jgi:histone-lysine N-methyltransferase SETMAR
MMGNLLVNVFMDHKGVFLMDFMEKGTKSIAASYCATLQRLRAAIKQQGPGMLTKGVLLLHDNIRTHISTATQLMQCFSWTILEHPPHSPDPAPNDFHLFLALMDRLSGHK